MKLDANQLAFVIQILSILASLGVMARVIWVTEERVRALTDKVESLETSLGKFEQKLEQRDQRQEQRDEAFRTTLTTLSIQVAGQAARISPPPGPR